LYKKPDDQLSIDDFMLPFEGKLKKSEMKIINSDDGQDDHSDLETNLNGWIDSV